MTATSDTPPAKKRRRRWFRFRLRTLFVLVTVLALLMGWIAKERIQSQREWQIADQLWTQSVYVELGGPYESYILDPFAEPQGGWRSLAQQFLGNRIVRILILESETGRNCEDLAPLAGLTNLQHLTIESTLVSDLRPLARLKNLQRLDIYSAAVRDLTPLAGLKNLQDLQLVSTQVTDLTPLAGVKNLETLVLKSTPVSDLTPLAKLKSLQELYIDDMPVSDEQVKSLQQALPNCYIVRRD